MDIIVKESEKFTDGQDVKIAGIITSVKKKYTKNNKIMAFVTLEDLYGTVELVIFPTTYEKYEKILQNDNIVKVTGKVSIKEDEKSKVLVSNMTLIEKEKNDENKLDILCYALAYCDLLSRHVYKENNVEVTNVYITRYDIERVMNIFDKNDGIERIYINFCNPWPKGKHRKKRLTHTKQLEKYKQFLAENGEVYFKTDDDDLFNSSLIYFEESGFEIVSKTYDLHKKPIFENNIETEHEKMFSEQGIKIKALIAKCRFGDSSV